MGRFSRWTLTAFLLTNASCKGCGTESAEVDDLSFTRCAQVDAPEPRTLQTDALKLELKDRVATLTPRGALRIAAFTGPVDGPLSRSDMAQLTAAAPQLVFLLGGLGASLELASANLALLATLRVPVLFVPGGADRLHVVKEAFGDLPDDAAERLIQASGLRVLEVGKERFAIVSGAPLGRYALDDDACGFSVDDLDELRELLEARGKARTWLLSWGAPAGFGVTRGFGGIDAGSVELAQFAKQVGASGGLFAYPEVQAALPSQGKGGPGGFALVVPRLGRTGSLREGRGFVPRALGVLSLGETGLGLAGRP